MDLNSEINDKSIPTPKLTNVKFKVWKCDVDVNIDHRKIQLNDKEGPVAVATTYSMFQDIKDLIDGDLGKANKLGIIEEPKLGDPVKSKKGYVLIKNYAENVGVLEILTKNHVVKDTGLKLRVGHTWGNLCKINPHITK